MANEMVNELKQIKDLLRLILNNMGVECNNKEADNIISEIAGKNNVSNSKTLDLRIKELFLLIGVPFHILGYTYLREAIILYTNDPDKYRHITVNLYPAIAKKYNTIESRVERDIRHAIEVAWTRGNHKFLEELFAFTISPEKGRPTNSEFIARIVDYMRYNN